MIAGSVLLFALGVFAFGAGIVNRSGWLVGAGVLAQVLVLWEATAP